VYPVRGVRSWKLEVVDVRDDVSVETWVFPSSSGASLMSDNLIDCPVCDGLGYVPCDDGSEVQCEQCEGTGKVPAVQV
jgi:DnaJ-class molecular chaperone